MNTKKIAILGSTGSIGTQALDIIRNNRDKYSVSVLSCAKNTDLLIRQIDEFNPNIVITKEEKDALFLSKQYKSIEFDWGEKGLCHAAASTENDIVLNSLVGMQGLVPTYHAILAGNTIALANKETLVAGGEIIMNASAEHGVKILPVDSEHSAIFQSLQGNENNKIKKIILTASGGPFRGFTRADLYKVKLEDALKHPNWTMGKKVTVDSATMMNKGLEVIEAHYLFGVPYEKIDVVVHPQSIIHSMVEYEDRAVIAQLGLPDMRVPISYAFSYPNRIYFDAESLDLSSVASLTFEKPDLNVFKPLRLAYDSLKTGGGAPCVLNAANETLCAMFIAGRIGFLDISDIAEEVMSEYVPVNPATLEEVLYLDAETKRKVTNKCLKLL